MRYLALVVLLALSPCYSQNTLALEAGATSPKATLSDVSWIAGHWKGEAFGGIVEEIWSPPLGDSMMFVFKLVAQGKTKFYEIGHIREVEGTLILQLKHFHGNLKGWETKDETVDFKLVKLEDDRVFFDQFTFERINDNEINLFVVIKDKDQEKEVKFNYKRQ